MKRIKHIAAIALLVTSAGATAAPTTYKFDSVSRLDAGRTAAVAIYSTGGTMSITGVLENTTTPSTLTFTDSTSPDSATTGSRCIPYFLTMMEKPGRYVLYVTIDPADTYRQFISCGLELKS